MAPDCLKVKTQGDHCCHNAVCCACGVKVNLLTVGKVPERKGEWLGLDLGDSWRPLAKFRNEAAAEEFLRIMRDTPGVGYEDLMGD
jgi:hypothetical protein